MSHIVSIAGMVRLFLVMCVISRASAATVDLSSTPLTYMAGSGAVVLDGAALLTGANFSSGSGFSVALAIDALEQVIGEDLVQIATDGTVTVSGTTVSVSGVPIGTYSLGINGTSLLVLLNAGVDATAVQTLMRHLAYHNLVGSGATTGARTLTMTVTDASGPTSDSRDVTVKAGNSAPVLTVGGNLPVPRSGRLAFSVSYLSAIDVDAAHTADKLTYELASLPENGVLLLATINGAGDITGSVVLGGAATTFTQADVSNGRLRYEHLGNAAVNDGFTVRVRDPLGATTTLTAVGITIVGTAGNPVITLPTGALVVTEGPEAVAMDPSAPASTTVLVTDSDGVHYRRGTLEFSIVDAAGQAAGTSGDVISLRTLSGSPPNAAQTGYLSRTGNQIYIRHSASPLSFIATAVTPPPDRLLATIDATVDGSAGQPLRLALASTVVQPITDQANPPGDLLGTETEVVTPAAVAQLIANVTVAHIGTAPPSSPRFLKVRLREADPATGEGSATRPLTIIPINDPPAFPTRDVSFQAVVGRPFVALVPASDPDLPNSASLAYQFSGPSAGVSLDAATGAISWTPTTTGTVMFKVVASDDQAAGSKPLAWSITAVPAPSADPPYIISDPLVEIAEGELIFHPFTIVPPSSGGTVTAESVQVVGDAPADALVTRSSPLSWTLTTSAAVVRPSDGIYTFGLHVQLTIGGTPCYGYQPITLVVRRSVSGSN